VMSFFEVDQMTFGSLVARFMRGITHAQRKSLLVSWEELGLTHNELDGFFEWNNQVRWTSYWSDSVVIGKEFEPAFKRATDWVADGSVPENMIGAAFLLLLRYEDSTPTPLLDSYDDTAALLQLVVRHPSISLESALRAAPHDIDFSLLESVVEIRTDYSPQMSIESL